MSPPRVTSPFHGSTEMFYLVCFDIVNDRIRYRAAKTLKGYGIRVQKSVFECPNLTEERFLKLKNRLEDIIDNGEDSVRYYRICKACLSEMEWSGIGRPPEKKPYKVV